MASGEVLFILAFIVLPTAILVSSAWAVLFVRSRPDRNMQHWDDERSDEDAQPTAVIPMRPEHTGEPSAAVAFDDDLPVTEHDVVVITASDELHDDDDVEASQAPVPVEVEPEPEPAPVMRDDSAIESPVLQSTEDLGDVAEVLRDLQQVAEQEEVLAVIEPTVEAEPEPVPVEEPPVALPEEEEPQEEVVFSETSELPGLDLPASEEDHDDDNPEPEDERPAGSNWRRRKQSVKLTPGDGEAPRTRGRNRDAQRQVPQLGRFGRARNDGTQNPPPDGESEQDSTPART